MNALGAELPCLKPHPAGLPVVLTDCFHGSRKGIVQVFHCLLRSLSKSRWLQKGDSLILRIETTVQPPLTGTTAKTPLHQSQNRKLAQSAPMSCNFWSGFGRFSSFLCPTFSVWPLFFSRVHCLFLKKSLFLSSLERVVSKFSRLSGDPECVFRFKQGPGSSKALGFAYLHTKSLLADLEIDGSIAFSISLRCVRLHCIPSMSNSGFTKQSLIFTKPETEINFKHWQLINNARISVFTLYHRTEISLSEK